jgi:hypothetical protein
MKVERLRITDAGRRAGLQEILRTAGRSWRRRSRGNQGASGSARSSIPSTWSSPAGQDGYRFIVITFRPPVRGGPAGKASLNNPFTVAVFTVPDFGWGDGQLYTKAKLTIDSDGPRQPPRTRTAPAP